ncbi:MAG: hypothetical protein ACREMR_07155, partial [Gemmatimonadales bacterium]
LQECTHLVFCGYSLPDADMHVKYLVKTAQMNRGRMTEALLITLLNGYREKPESNSQEEFDRYARLFGPETVSDSRLSFEDFAADPGVILGRCAFSKLCRISSLNSVAPEDLPV